MIAVSPTAAGPYPNRWAQDDVNWLPLGQHVESTVSMHTSNPIYYGWLVVAACVFIAMAGSGAYTGFGVFIIPMSDEFGWSRSAISLAASVGTIVGGLSQPFFGRIFDRIGGRRLILVGLVGFGLSNVLLMFTNNIVYLVVVFGVLVALTGSAGTFNTVVALVSKWFERRRATAISIVSAGGSLSGMVFVPFIAVVIPLVGWRNTWLILGLIVLGLAVPIAFLIIRDRPSDVGQFPDGDDAAAHAAAAGNVSGGPLEVENWLHALKSAPFWQISAGYFVCGVTTAMISTHFVPYAVEEGFSASSGAIAFGVLSGLNVVGVMGAGLLGDRYGRKNVLALVYGTRALAFAVLLTAPGLWGLFGFAVISGFSWFGTVPLTTSLTAEVYGLRNIGTLSGVVYLAHSIGGALAVQFAGIMKDITGDYTIPFGLGGVLLLVAAAISYSIRERSYSSRYQLAKS